MHRILLALACAAVLVVAGEAQAQGLRGLSVAGRVGTLGPGLELTTSLAPRLNVRLAGHYMGYTRTDTNTDLSVDLRSDADVRLASGALFADVLPFRRYLRLTAGLVLNRNQATVVVTPTESFSIGDKVLGPERVGGLTAVAGHRARVNPYLGLGLGNSVRPGKRIGLLLDLGVLYTSAPSIEVEGEGMFLEIARKAPEVEAALDENRFFPLVALGLSLAL